MCKNCTSEVSAKLHVHMQIFLARTAHWDNTDSCEPAVSAQEDEEGEVEGGNEEVTGRMVRLLSRYQAKSRLLIVYVLCNLGICVISISRLYYQM